MKILKFYAEWCGPCKQLSKNIDKFKELHPEVEIIPINADEEEELVDKYNVRNVPVLIKIVDDTEVARQSGLLTLPGLVKFILEDE